MGWRGKVCFRKTMSVTLLQDNAFTIMYKVNITAFDVLPGMLFATFKVHYDIKNMLICAQLI